MTEFRKKRTGKKPEKQTLSSRILGSVWKKRTLLGIVSAAIALILVTLGVSRYFSEDARYLRSTVIQVDDSSIRMDYFLKRVRLAGVDPTIILNTLTNEELIKYGAVQYGIEVTPSDIDQAIRTASASSENISGNISDSEFKKWYSQELDETGLSDAEYKEITRITILANRLRDYLAERIPTVAKQIHLHTIMLKTYEEAQKARERWAAGEDFATLAKELSVDENSREKGGDLGWIPRGVMAYQYDEIAFNLGTDNVSDPVPFYPNSSNTSGTSQTDTAYYALLMVSEEANSREIDDDAQKALQYNALDNWLYDEAKYHKISLNLTSASYAWVNWQLAKEPGNTTNGSE